MQIICPNLSNPQVAREFEELKQATSENAAYHIWAMNNGYNIDAAPNGEPSVLFQSLLKYYHRDRQKAIRAKAKVYSKSFIKWFGDWTSEDKSNVSKAVDQNGEPLVVYHTGSDFEEYDMSKTGLLYGQSKRFGINLAFFTPNLMEAMYYKRHNEEWFGEYNHVTAAYLNIKNVLEVDGNTEDRSDEEIGKQFVEGGFDGFSNIFPDYDGIYEYAVPTSEQIKHIENKGSFGSEEKNIYRHITSEQDYRDFLDEMNLDEDKADQFVFNFITKILNVNPRKKYDKSIPMVPSNYSTGNEIHGVHKLQSFILKVLGLNDLDIGFFDDEDFKEKLYDYIYNKWKNDLVQNLETVKEKYARQIDGLYKELSNEHKRIKLLQQYLSQKDYSTDEAKLLAKEILQENKRKDGDRRYIGYTIQRLKEHTERIKDDIHNTFVYRYAELLKLKNRLLATNVIDNIEKLVYDRILLEVESYKLPKDLWERNVKPHLDLFELAKKASNGAVLKNMHNNVFDNSDKTFDEKGHECRKISSTSLFEQISKIYPKYNKLIKIIQNVNPKVDIYIYDSDDYNELFNAGKLIAGASQYEPKVNTVRFNSNADISTIMHEMIHSVSSYALVGHSEGEESLGDSSLQPYIDYVIKYLKDNLGNNYGPANVFGVELPANIYGLTNPAEFIAELFSNDDFRELLDNIPPMEESKYSSLLEQFVSQIFKFINRLFKLNESETALTQATKLAIGVIRTQKMYQSDIYEQIELWKKSLPETQKHILNDASKEESLSIDNIYDDVNQMSDDRKSAVQNAVSKQLRENPNSTKEEISETIKEAQEQFNQGQQRSIASRTKDLLIESYGLKAVVGEDGKIHYEGNSVIVSFVEYLEDELGEHEGWYDYNSVSTAAHHLIQVALNGNECSTFNHEIAHHYVRMFWGTPLIQNALGAVYRQGMTMQECEEALVDEMTSRTGILFQTDTEQKSFYQKFWSKFSEMIAKAFGIKNKTYRENLLNNVTKAYALNEHQQTNPNYKSKFEMHNGRMYKDTYTKKKVEARNKKKQERNASHYSQTVGHRKDQKAVKLIVEGAVHRKEILSRYADITDREVVALNVFEQEVLEFSEAIKEQRKQEFERLKASGESTYKANRKKSDSDKEKQLNINIIHKFLDNAQQELEIAINRFRSAQSAMFMKVTTRTEEDPTSGDINTTYVNASEYGTDENVTQQDFTFDELSRLGRELISYYQDIDAELDNMLSNRTVSELYSEDKLEELRERKEAIRSLIDEVSGLYKEALNEKVIQFVDQYVDNYKSKLDEDHRERLKRNMRKWVDGQYDLGMGSNASIHRLLEAKMGVAEWSQSPIIRMMHHMIFDLNTENEDLVLKRKNELYAAREKAKKALLKTGKITQFFSTFDKIFLEYDENGNPTGNLLSKINKGKYYKKRAAFVDELIYGRNGIEDQIRDAIGNPNYELDVDTNGNPVFPEDSRVTKIEIDYLVKYNEFLCENTERKYTPQYYRQRLKILCDLNDDMSVKPTSNTNALHAQNEIQSQIDDIITPCIIKGKPHTELLDDVQLEQLQILENQRSLLSSPYDNYGNEKQVGTEEYDTYIRLKAWKDFLKSKNIVYAMDQETFEESLNKAKNKKKFRKLNTYRKVNERFWDLFSDELGSIDDDKLNELREKRSQLVSIVKPRGLNQPNLDIVWDEANKRIRPEYEQFFINLKKLDEAIKNRQIELRHGKKASQKEAAFIDAMIDKRDAMKEGTTWYEYMSDSIKKRHYATRAVGAKDKAQDEIQKYLRYTDSQGKNHELSIFSTTYPKQSRLKDKDGEFSTIQRVPIRAYSLLDKESSDPEWVNKDFKEDSDESIQPKQKLYKNKEYDKLLGEGAQKEVVDYYNLLRDTMVKSYGNISFLSKYNDMIPQRAARSSSILSRFNPFRIRNWGMFRIMGIPVLPKYEPLHFILKRKWDITENDTDINEVIFKQRDDKTISGAIPVRYIKRLENPEYVSGDLLSSVLSFYSMSLNYKGKQQMAPIMNSLHEQMLKTNINSEQANVAKGLIYRQIYGKTKTGIPDGILTPTLKRLIKFTGISRAFAMVSLLGFSAAASIVAVLDALTSLVTDAGTRRSFGYSDLLWAVGKIIRQTIPTAMSTGSVKTTTFGLGDLNSALEAFGLSGNIANNTQDSDMNQFRRIFKDSISQLAMSPFSMGEHLVNSFTLLVNMSSYRLYGDEFLSRDQFMQKAQEEGLTRNQARIKYQTATKLFNAYHTDKKGNFVPNSKSEAGKKLLNMDPSEYRKFKHRVVSKGVSKAASYNALIPETERTELQSNIIWNWVTMVRNFLLIGFWERFSKLNDFYDPETEEDMTEGQKSQMRAEQGYYSGGLNMMTGEITTGRARAAARLIFTKDNGEQKFLNRTFKNISNLVGYGVEQLHKTDRTKYEARQERCLSEADLHGFHMVVNELAIIGLLTMLSAWFHNRFAGDNDDEYWFQLVDLILLRMPLERITMWHPNTVMEIITSITAGKTMFDRLSMMGMIKQAMKDYQEHGLNYSDYERVKTGGFTGETVLYRETLKTFSWMGVYNLYRSTHTPALESSKSFYEKLGGINPTSWWLDKEDNKKNSKKTKNVTPSVSMSF